jgi:hypothetical protein
MYTGNKSWAEDLKKEGLAVVEIGIRDEEARISSALASLFWVRRRNMTCLSLGS